MGSRPDACTLRFSVYKPAYVYGGPARSVPSLCEGLAEAGADIEVFTTNANRRERLDVPSAGPSRSTAFPSPISPWSTNAIFMLRPGGSRALPHSPIRRHRDRRLIQRFAGSGRFRLPEGRNPVPGSTAGPVASGSFAEKRWKKRLYLSVAGLRTLNAAAGIHCADPVEAESLAKPA